MSGVAILVADDERALRDAVAYALRQAGYSVDLVESGEQALARSAASAYAVVILDVMLPGLSGFEICRRIRATSDVPIILLTARDAEADRVYGLEAGADDYVTKPFSVAELVSRVRSILRRRELDAGAHLIRVGELEIDQLSQRVLLRGRRLGPTPSEYDVLLALAQAGGQVVSRRAIVQHLWSSEHVGDERVCDVHVHALRRKIASVGGDPQLIATVRGRGYALSGGPRPRDDVQPVIVNP